MKRSLSPVLAMVVVAPWLLAPTGGNTGGCSEESVPVDTVAYCQAKKKCECDRAWARGEQDDAQHAECVDSRATACESFFFGADCQPVPTKRAAEACLGALCSAERLDEEFEDMPECTRICGGTGSLAAPAESAP